MLPLIPKNALTRVLFNVVRGPARGVTTHTATNALPAPGKPIPAPRGNIATPEAFLRAIGRSSETKLSPAPTEWDAFWRIGGAEMKEAGMAVRDRRYILWAMNRFRLGEDPAKYAHEAKPKKKIRGWGPSVQFGKRIRSRRKQ